MSTSLRERPPPRPLAPRLPREGRRRSLTRRLSERPRRPDSLDPEAKDRVRQRPEQGQRPGQGEVGRDQDRDRRGQTTTGTDSERPGQGQTTTGTDRERPGQRWGETRTGTGRPGQGQTGTEQDRDRDRETRTGRNQDRNQTCNRREQSQKEQWDVGCWGSRAWSGGILQFGGEGNPMWHIGLTPPFPEAERWGQSQESRVREREL